MKEFHEALYWGSADMAIAYVEDSQRAALRPIIKSMSSGEKTVDSKIDSTVFSDDVFEATVEVKVRAYKVPYYVVDERTDIQKWQFSMSSGWQLVELKKGS